MLWDLSVTNMLTFTPSLFSFSFSVVGLVLVLGFFLSFWISLYFGLVKISRRRYEIIYRLTVLRQTRVQISDITSAIIPTKTGKFLI